MMALIAQTKWYEGQRKKGAERVRDKDRENGEMVSKHYEKPMVQEYILYICTFLYK